MTTDTTHPFHGAMTEICKTVISTVADHPNDSLERKVVRQQTIADTMVSLMPHDPLETMLAGQCVIFDAIVHDAARDLLRGQAQPFKLRSRPQICASARLFLANLTKFEQAQARAIDNLAAEQPAEMQPARRTTPAGTEPAPQPEQRRQPVAPASRPRADAIQSQSSETSPAQTNPTVPFAAEREIAQILAGRGQTGARMDATLAAAYPGTQRAEERPSLTDDGTEPSQRETRVEELV
jgi:hypothetical protein